MKSRRSFLKTVGAGTALTTAAFSSNPAIASQLLNFSEKKEKQLQIGIIRAENSHTTGYGK
jgi:hypothetical protein